MGVIFHFSLRIEKKPASCWKRVCSCAVFHPEYSYWWREGAQCLRGEAADCRLHGHYGGVLCTPRNQPYVTVILYVSRYIWDFSVLWVNLGPLNPMWNLLLPSRRHMISFTENSTVPPGIHPISSGAMNLNRSQIQTKSDGKTKLTTYIREWWKVAKRQMIICLTKAVKRTSDMEWHDYTLTPVQ